MISAVLGAVIMSMSTVALLIAIRLGDNAIDNAGKYPLTRSEISTVLNIPGYTEDDISNLQLDIKTLTLPEVSE